METTCQCPQCYSACFRSIERIFLGVVWFSGTHLYLLRSGADAYCFIINSSVPTCEVVLEFGGCVSFLESPTDLWRQQTFSQAWVFTARWKVGSTQEGETKTDSRKLVLTKRTWQNVGLQWKVVLPTSLWGCNRERKVSVVKRLDPFADIFVFRRPKPGSDWHLTIFCLLWFCLVFFASFWRHTVDKCCLKLHRPSMMSADLMCCRVTVVYLQSGKTQWKPSNQLKEALHEAVGWHSVLSQSGLKNFRLYFLQLPRLP